MNFLSAYRTVKKKKIPQKLDRKVKQLSMNARQLDT